MEKIIIEPKNEQELLKIREILSGMGIIFMSESDYELQRQMQARKDLAGWAEGITKYEIADEEIQSMVEDVRAERYGRKKKD